MTCMLGPPQTRRLVVENYLLSRTKCYCKRIVSDASIPHIGVLVVDNYVRPARARELRFTTHAQNTIRMLKCVFYFASCRQLNRQGALQRQRRRLAQRVVKKKHIIP